MVSGLLTAGAQAAYASTAGTLAMTLTEPDGSTPMANTSMNVFYIPPGDSDASTSFPLIGSGVTNSSGAVTTSLNTSMVTSDLADDGDGNDNAFNAVAVAVDSAGDLVLKYEVLEMGGSASDSATAASGAVMTTLPAGSTAGVTPTLTSATKDTKFAWVPVLADNSGAGEETDINYTFNSSVARQTKVTAATSLTDSSPWNASGEQEESTDRDASTDWNEAGSYHEYIWAKYAFRKTSLTLCTHWVHDNLFVDARSLGRLAVLGQHRSAVQRMLRDDRNKSLSAARYAE
jgi:hypothetical protein